MKKRIIMVSFSIILLLIIILFTIIYFNKNNVVNLKVESNNLLQVLDINEVIIAELVQNELKEEISEDSSILNSNNTTNNNNLHSNNINQVQNNNYYQTISQKIESKMNSISLREKIGQMLVISYSGTNYTQNLDNILKQVKPGGFILFADNISTYSNTKEFISKIKNSESIPITIGIDQEGGRVQRIKQLPDANVLSIPDMYSLGKTNNSSLAYNFGKVIAEELIAFGINLDYAPVIDIFSNPNNTVIGTRAFGNTAENVINMSIPLAKGLKEHGIIPVYKHFPGHGDTNTDSHVELPVINKTKEELYQREFLPFKAAINNNADIIMVAHIALPNVTGNYIPSSLSYDIVTGILRNEMGYNGVVVTDAVNMKALTDNYSIDEIYKLCINAGVDIILMPLNPVEAVNIIENLVNNGSIPKYRIDESVRRILKMKYSNNLEGLKTNGKEKIGTQEHINIIDQVK